MLAFKDFITEAFDKPFRWHWAQDHGDEIIAEFTTKGGVKYVVGFRDEFDEGDWYLEFRNLSVPKGKSMGKTGTGEAIGVLSTVLDVVKAFLKEHFPVSVGFLASKEFGDDKSKLYTKIANKLKKEAKKLGYKVNWRDIFNREADVEMREFSIKQRGN